MKALTYPFKEGDCVDCENLTDKQVQMILDRMWELGASPMEGLRRIHGIFQKLLWSSNNNTVFTCGSSIKENTNRITWEQIMRHEDGLSKNNEAINHNEERKNEKEPSIGKLIDNLFSEIADSSIIITVSGNGEVALSSNFIEEINATEMDAGEVSELCNAMLVIEKCMSGGVKGE